MEIKKIFLMNTCEFLYMVNLLNFINMNVIKRDVYSSASNEIFNYHNDEHKEKHHNNENDNMYHYIATINVS